MTVWAADTPCWHAQCDTCHEHEPRHFDTLQELIDELQAVGWWIPWDDPAGGYHCKLCADEMIDRMAGLRNAWLE